MKKSSKRFAIVAAALTLANLVSVAAFAVESTDKVTCIGVNSTGSGSKSSSSDVKSADSEKPAPVAKSGR